MSEKNIKARVVHKHDIESNWLLATNFTPKQGEIIVYDVDDNYDYERIKIGDGVQNVNALPFVDDALRAELVAQVDDVDDRVDAVSALIGDTSVSEQINAAAVNNQSDWSVNDETIPSYVKNRPFYTTDPIEIELCDGTYDFIEFSDSGVTLHRAKIDLDYTHFVDEIGQEVVVIYDGTTYKLESKYMSAMDAYYVGNGSLFNGLGLTETDTGEPFMYPLGTTFFTSETGAQHTIAIYVNKVTDVIIPHKYLGLNVWTGEGGGSVIANNNDNVASGYNAFAIGLSTTASGSYSHAEGSETVASGDNSHAEGNDTTASNFNSHAEGNFSIASGHSAHAEGVSTEASGQGSHTEGQNTKASAWNAHAEGQGTEAASKSQHVFGEYNIVDKSSGVAERGKYIQIAGNGGSANAKSNAYTLDWSGNAWFQGSVKIGGTCQDDEAAKELATQEYVQSFLPKITTITLPTASWTGDTNPWSQVVTVNGVTANSKVDLQPTAVQIVEMQNNDVALMAENDDGVITVYAIGSKPTVDYTMQALITEVAVV